MTMSPRKVYCTRELENCCALGATSSSTVWGSGVPGSASPPVHCGETQRTEDEDSQVPGTVWV